MSQADFTIPANQDGTDFRNEVTAANAAMASHHKGPSAPSYAVAGMIWIDDSASPILLFKAYDGADWILTGTLNATTNVWTPANSALVSGANLFAVDSGAVNAMVATFSPAITALTAGLILRVQVANSVTGATTLNVNGLGAIAIKKAYSNAIATGDILVNEVIEVVYDGTNFQLISSIFTIPATVSELKAGTDNTKVITPIALAGLWSRGTDIASASTLTIPSTGGGYFVVTGTTTVTAISETSATGRPIIIEFAGALTLTHNATSLILPGAANVTTAAGDVAKFVQETTGNWRCTGYMRASGKALVQNSPLTIISQTTFTNASSAAWNNLTGDAYKLVGYNIYPQTTNAIVATRTSSNNGSSYDSGASNYSWNVEDSASASPAGALDTVIGMHHNGVTVSGGAVGGSHSGVLEMDLYGINQSAGYPRVKGQYCYMDSAGNNRISLFTGNRMTSAAFNAFQIFANNGNINGTFTLYQLALN